MKNITTTIKHLLTLSLLFAFTSSMAQKQAARSFYQITIYHYENAGQEDTINHYLQDALLPSLHRAGIKNVGVFTSLANDTATDKTMYVLLPVRSLSEVADIAAKLNVDKAYNTAGSAYLNAAYNAAPYTRMETILLKAFPLAPIITQPQLKAPHNERVYELRSYEGATEKLYASKVKMFNTGDEVGIFKKLNFNAVFYAEVLSGSHMPNLMYMTTFENMPDREAKWKLFMNDDAFKKLLAMPEYQHNVSKADIFFLRPTDYSDL